MGTRAAPGLLELLSPVVAAVGYDLETVEVTPAGRRRLVRVVVDRDGGVSLDGVAEVSTAVSAAMDEADPLGASPYVLEVTSPGVDRPLTEPRHWRRAAGRLVTVSLHQGDEVTGRVVRADDDIVLLEVKGSQLLLAHGDVARGAVQLEFNRVQPAGQDEEEG